MSLERVKAVLHEALELSPDARQSYIEKACDGDTGLASRVRALLDSHEGAGAFLSEPSIDTGSAVIEHAEEPIPDSIGDRVLGSLARADSASFTSCARKPIRALVWLMKNWFGRDGARGRSWRGSRQAAGGWS
ncbi:MAG: hypothetical protein H6814_09220 [Phycisphaeraceae bacterium]|nr:hypothetical protein [Phycisphaeraceae bacterium]